MTGRLSIGAAVVYRIQFDTKPAYRWVSDNHVYGVRAFAKVGLAKGVFLQGEYEHFYSHDNELTNNSQRWMGGLGKSFRMSKRMKGEALLLNNFNHRSDPVYSNRINIRTSVYVGRSLR